MAPQAAPYTLRFSDLRFELKPDRRLEWPSLQRGTILRGAFGSILKEIACDPLCADHTACEFASECAYEKLFAPMNRPKAMRLSLNKDLPRPFVLIPDDNDPPTIAAGGRFAFVARLFGEAVSMHPYVTMVFSQLMRRGFGRDRVGCALIGPAAPRSATLNLAVPPVDGTSATVEITFLTPTFLKQDGGEVRSGRAAFAPLIRRARDRLSS